MLEPRYVAAFRAAPPMRAGLLALPPPRRRRAPDDRTRLRRILVAADGRAASDGALAIAGLLARRDGATVDVVSLVPRWGPPPTVYHAFDMTGELLGARAERILPQGERAFGRAVRWRLRVLDGGDLSAALAEIAEADGHDLIVTGRGSGWIDRWLRRPTALAIARVAPAPVLAVPPSVTRLPSRAVVALQDGARESDVARAAAAILGARSAVERADARVAEDADLVALAVESPRSLAERVRGGPSRRVFRATDGCVLLHGPRASAGRVAERRSA